MIDGIFRPASDGSLEVTRFRVLGNVIYYTSLICHVALIYGFHLIEQPQLSMFNIGSVVVIVFAVLAHRTRRFDIGFSLYTAEIVAHAAAATLVLGRGSGFFIYVTIPLMIMSFLPNVRERVKLVVNIGLLVLMLTLIAVSYAAPPARPVEPALLDQILMGNLVLMALISGTFMFIFSRVIRLVEAKLIAANRQLHQFSGAVSDFLDPMLVESLSRGGDVSPKMRPMTVLFSDLVGSTPLSRKMDESAYGEMIDEYADAMNDIIKRHGGFVEDISGDGIYAYVGNMSSNGEAQDACAVIDMAVEMQHALPRLNARFKKVYDLQDPLRARIGISSGQVYVGKSSGVRSIYTANGACVNLAAKLEQGLKAITDRGGILISEATAGLIGADTQLSSHQVRIGDEMITAYKVSIEGGVA